MISLDSKPLRALLCIFFTYANPTEKRLTEKSTNARKYYFVYQTVSCRVDTFEKKRNKAPSITM